jgi:hypothetical protein
LLKPLAASLTVLLTPLSELGRIQSLPSEKGSDLAALLEIFGFFDNLQFVGRRELSAGCFGEDLGDQIPFGGSGRPPSTPEGDVLGSMLFVLSVIHETFSAL